MNRIGVSLAVLVFAVLALPANRAEADGDVARGAQGFGLCAACHSLRPDFNKTGPSLAGVWNRTAGTLKSFDRYSPAIRDSGVVWNATSLDAWLQDPARFIPGNRMTIRGLLDPAARADIIAFLKAVGEAERGGPAVSVPSAYAAEPLDLKNLSPDRLATSIRLCRDTYYLTTADGNTRVFWEQNLRFTTDSSAFGPKPGAPVVLPTGMFGDRSKVIFTNAADLGAFIKNQC